MAKPDWATRLQRTFARKYDAGFAKGLMLGKAVGARDERDICVPLAYDLGAQDEQTRIVKIIESKGWVGKTLDEDVANLVELVKWDTK